MLKVMALDKLFVPWAQARLLNSIFYRKKNYLTRMSDDEIDDAKKILSRH